MQELEHTIVLRGCVHNRLTAAQEKALKEITNRRPGCSFTEAVSVPLHIVGDPFRRVLVRGEDVTRAAVASHAQLQKMYKANTSGSRGHAANVASATAAATATRTTLCKKRTSQEMCRRRKRERKTERSDK